MASEQKPLTLQDIIKGRQQGEFVGREEQCALFQQNLTYALDAPRRRFIFAVSGQGGVGKTLLLRRRFREIAESAGAVTAWTDEAEDDVPQVMGRMAEQFEEQGCSLTTFAPRYRLYRQSCQEMQSDPQAPQGFAARLARTLTRGGIRVARHIPGAGLALEFVDEEPAADKVSEWAAYVARKLKNPDDVQLVLEPAEVLTPLFVADLRRVAAHHAIALFFDTYERTCAFLDPWLSDMLQGRYGAVPAQIVVTIAGRRPLDENTWGRLEGIMARLPLDPFTEEEARAYLARKGITNEQVVGVILQLSGRLPLLVATLAKEGPRDPAQIGDPSGEAVERFLKWVEDGHLRRTALDASLPRYLNHDVLAVVTGQAGAGELFEWLQDMPFVDERPEGWVYHSVVREPMLRRKRRESPQGWRELQGQLAEYHEKLRDNLGLDERAAWRDESWQHHSLEALYHRLCRMRHQHLGSSLSGFLAALKASRRFGIRWAEVMFQAGRDGESAQVQHWGERLLEGVRAYEEDSFGAAAEMFTALLAETALEATWRPVALDWRGYLRRRAGQYEGSLADLSEAVRLDPQESEHYAGRGATYREMGRYEEALADLGRAIELKPDYEWAIGYRGDTCRVMGRYEEALADLNRAIGLKADYEGAIALRGDTYRHMGRYEEALADFDRAIELKPDYEWAIASRGRTYEDMGRYEEALADFDRAIELKADYEWAIASRGLTYREMGRYEEALADFDRAVELKADDAWNLAGRGMTYREMGRYEEALADFDRAIELKADDAWHLADRGLTYREMGRYEEALADFDRAIELKADSKWTIALRGETYREMGRYEEALADLNRAIGLKADYALAIASRGETYREIGRYEEALADFDRAIELKADYEWAIANRGATYRLIGRYEEALADFDRAIELKADSKWAIALRGETYRRMGRYEEAVADLNRAIGLKADYEWAIASRGLAYQQMGRYEEALADFDRAIELKAENEGLIAFRGETYRHMGRYEEALADFDRAIELKADDTWNLAQRGFTYRLLGRYEEALADFDRAIELEADYELAVAARGETYRLMGRYEDALADFDRAIELRPDYDFALFIRALVYRSLEQRDNAQTDLSSAIEYALQKYINDPKDWNNTCNLALYRLAVGDADEAERLYGEVVAGGASVYAIRTAIGDLDDFLALFPDHELAHAMRSLLESHTEDE